MRHPALGLPARGATPAFTKVKHDLRDWIESRTARMQWNGSRWIPDPTVLQEQLNDEIDRAGLFCDAPSNPACRDQASFGYLMRITIEIKHRTLIIKTGVAIQTCGFDESAYAYRYENSAWRRFWQSEQNDYREGKYFPQWIHVVEVSPADFRPGSDRSEHLVLTIGSEPWCSSNWHDVYYRVWQTKATLDEPGVLLDGREWAFIADDTRGSASKGEVFIEYWVSSVDGGFTRPEIRHYILTDNKLQRTDPVALTPHQFAAFWLAHPWPEISRWTAPASRPRLRQWSSQNKGPFSEFAEPTLHCKQRPDLWQLSTHSGENQEHEVFFLIRWRPPERFSMVDISDKPSPDCTEPDPEADNPLSLFRLR
jgi:hypothetical protein